MRTPRIWKLLAMVAVLSGFPTVSAVAGTVTGLPLGPAFGSDPQLALTDGTVSNDGTNLSITLNFSTPIAPPSAFAANSVFGYIFLDTDQSQLTGSTLGQLDSALGLGLGQIPPGQIPNGLGIDYVVDLDSVNGSVPGQVDVLSATSLNTLASVPISYSSLSLSLTIPIADLTDPVPVDSSVFFGAIIGNPGGPTDTLLGVPEPPSLVLSIPAVAFVGWYLWARRRSRAGF